MDIHCTALISLVLTAGALHLWISIVKASTWIEHVFTRKFYWPPLCESPFVSVLFHDTTSTCFEPEGIKQLGRVFLKMSARFKWTHKVHGIMQHHCPFLESNMMKHNMSYLQTPKLNMILLDITLDLTCHISQIFFNGVPQCATTTLDAVPGGWVADAQRWL